ncbi:MAG: HoxW protein [Proteobacteria bacterium]|jgi:hydrogenase maturation protease|nr:HoxW protein [Pseudomonadota bacterium]
MTRPMLVFGWGNRSRGDDALGPLCVERLRVALPDRDDIEFLDDYQLMVEHVLDLDGRSRVLFIDASLGCAPPFETLSLRAAADGSLSSHALSPQALLQVYRELHDDDPPPCTLLAIRGLRFELGEPPSAGAMAHLEAALLWAQGWLSRPQVLRRA